MRATLPLSLFAAAALLAPTLPAGEVPPTGLIEVIYEDGENTVRSAVRAYYDHPDIPLLLPDKEIWVFDFDFDYYAGTSAPLLSVEIKSPNYQDKIRETGVAYVPDLLQVAMPIDWTKAVETEILSSGKVKVTLKLTPDEVP